MTRALAVLIALAVGGCSTFTDLFTNSFVTNGFSGDPFPIDVDSDSGAVIVGMQTDSEYAAHDAPHTAVVELMSPFTAIDPGAGTAPSLAMPDVFILGATAPEGTPSVPRAELDQPNVFSVHECDTPACTVGTAADTVAVSGLIGADSLAGDAVRLRLADDEMFIFADIAGDDFARTLACDAVMDSPFQGGGTLLVGGTEYTFSNYRPVVSACLSFDGSTDQTTPQAERGDSVLFVISTEIGISLLGETAYNNYVLEQTAIPGVVIPTLDQLPVDTAQLIAGTVTGHHAVIPSIALVGESGQTARSPCRNVYANHLIASVKCSPGDDDDPCKIDEPCDQDHACDAPAEVELHPDGGLDVLVIPDDNPTLQALRAELRPSQPEVDGILGTNALRSVELDADYPHDRILGRCTDKTCAARPMITGPDARPDANNCIALLPF